MAAFNTLLIGYYGMQNTGDDMLMAAAAEGARRRYHSRNIAATGASGSEALQQLQLSAVQAKKQRFKGQDRLLKYWAAARSEHIIIGGGSVFHTAKDIAQKTHYLKLATSNQHCAAGVGLGPFNDVAAEKACATFLNACAFTGLFLLSRFRMQLFGWGMCDSKNRQRSSRFSSQDEFRTRLPSRLREY